MLALGTISSCRAAGIGPTAGVVAPTSEATTPAIAASPTTASSATPSPSSAAPPPTPTVVPQLTPTATSPPTRSPTPASRTLFVVDGHEDIAWNWLEFGRHPASDVLQARDQEATTTVPAIMGARTTGLPQWIAGRVGIIFATLFVLPQQFAASYGQPTQIYGSAAEAHERASQQLQAYHSLAAENNSIRIIKVKRDLQDIAAIWQSPPGEAQPVVGLVLLMEGADPIREPAEVADWYTDGLRIIGPAWSATRYAGGTGSPGPFTGLGHLLLREMAQRDMVLDLSHLAEEACLEALDTYPGPIIASHSNPRRFLPTDRGLADETIRRLAQRDGVIGIVPYNRYLSPGWQVGQSRAIVPVAVVADAIDHVVQLTGSTAHVALGSDFDGGFGRESIPSGMDSVADLLMIADQLTARGYSETAVQQVMNANWLRILAASLP